MANRTSSTKSKSTFTLPLKAPKWVAELAPKPDKYLLEMLKTHALYQMLDLQKRLEPFEQKYKITFPQFKKKVLSAKKEDFEKWDDFIIWEAVYDAYQIWAKRYESL